MEKKEIVGYTQGVFDMFHVGHLNLLNNARARCDRLIVGINSDKLVESYKNKTPVVSEDIRKTIVENIKAVDQAYVVDTLESVLWVILNTNDFSSSILTELILEKILTQLVL